MSGSEEATFPRIMCVEDGPYLVKDLKGLFDHRGKRLAPGGSIALCRCGGSSNKPFCDGTHGRIGFSGQKAPDRVPDRRDDYQGQSVTIHDNRGQCAHAGICTDELKAVWRMSEEPWIDPDGADVAAIIAVVKKCPSGALSYTIDGEEHLDLEQAPEVHVVKGGPYRVVGGVELKNVEWGEGVSREHYNLCRCGASKNKPFCDGSHWNVEFNGD